MNVGTKMDPRVPLSKLHTAFETNDQVLSDTERTKVFSQFRNAQRQLCNLDIRIRHLQDDIKNLFFMRKRNLILLENYRKILAPHRRLPNEILSEIFIYCTSDVVTLPPKRRDPLWTLLHVCSKWRQIGLETPSLWKRISIDYSRTRIGSAQFGRLSLIKRLLFRTDYSFTLDIQKTTVANLVKILVIPNIHRLKSLTLEPLECDIDPLFELPPGTAKVLEDVSIRVAAQNYIPLGPVTVFHGAPRLRRVTLNVSHFHPNLYRLPWAQLSDLHLPESDIHTDIGYAILSHCTSLERCTLRLKCDPVVTTSPRRRPPLVLRRLSCITVHVEHCNDYGYFFERFCFPRLTSFELISQRITRRPWDPRLTPIITHSPFLRKLLLQLPIQHDDIEPLFEEARSIAELSIPCGSPIPRPVLTKMSTGNLLPRLVSLTSRVDQDGLSYHLDMIEGRHNSKAHRASPMTTTYVFTVDKYWRDAVGESRLNMLREKGVDVTLRRI